MWVEMVVLGGIVAYQVECTNVVKKWYGSDWLSRAPRLVFQTPFVVCLFVCCNKKRKTILHLLLGGK